MADGLRDAQRHSIQRQSLQRWHHRLVSDEQHAPPSAGAHLQVGREQATRQRSSKTFNGAAILLRITERGAIDAAHEFGKSILVFDLEWDPHMLDPAGIEDEPMSATWRQHEHQGA
jgi:hypothetical protein